MMYVIAALSDMIYFIQMFFEKIFGFAKSEETE